MATTPPLPNPHAAGHNAWGTCVYIAMDNHRDRFIAATGTLIEAQIMAERDDEAIPYFAEGMTWVEGEPLPPLTQHRFSRRQWIGTVVTEPHARREFRVIEQAIEHPYEGRDEAMREEILRRRGLSPIEGNEA